jgi:hypothetical protein
MPAEPPPNETYLAEFSSDPAAGNPNLALGGEDTAAHGETPEPPGLLSPADRLGAERAERRHQRMLVREASTATRNSGTRDSDRAPRERATGSRSAQAPPGRRTLRDSQPVTLIATIAAGCVLGAILGALSVAGWVIGGLVAVLAVLFATALGQHSRTP